MESSGLDHGPISVHDKMRAMGLDQVPSTASLARIFRQAGVARLEPKKKPRAAWRRFVYPAPNACWQLDGTEYVLTGGRKCVIFQLIDDHSRFSLASHVARSETANAAITVFDKAVAVHGVPQRLLSDNGIALNPSRRGYLGQFVEHLSTLGDQAITGKPYKPTTQGRNERFHQTCSVTSTSSHWQAHSPNSKPRSTHSITSTTPNDLTKDYPGESPRAQHGKPPRWPESPTKSPADTPSSKSLSAPTTTPSWLPTSSAKSSSSTPGPPQECDMSATANPVAYNPKPDELSPMSRYITGTTCLAAAARQTGGPTEKRCPGEPAR